MRLWRFPLLTALAAIPIATATARQAAPPAVAVVDLKPPQDGKDGTLAVTYPKEALLDAVRRAIPDSVALPEQEVPDQLLYHDIRLSDLKAVDLKPSSLTLDGGEFYLAGSPTVAGALNAKYQHVVVTTQITTVKVFGREVKTSTPVVKRDWRPKAPAPFRIKVDVRGTCKLTLPGDGPLKDRRLHVETKAEYVRIASVRIDSDDPAYKIIGEVVGVVGQAFPNEGLNKPIKDGLTRGFDIDPFKDMPAADRDRLGQFRVKNVVVRTTETEVQITADLTPP